MSASQVLVLDDEAQIRRVLRTSLVAGGFVVREARTGEEALEMIREEMPDLLIVDINLPGMNGFEVCREIRESCDVPIIMLSVRNNEFDKVRALDAGADDYVVKPFGIQELLARIRANLRRHAPGSEVALGTFESRHLTIDFASRTVAVRGGKVRLTPKEFDLLHYLVNHRDKVLPHRELLQAVWGPDYGDQVEYLRVFINQLRKKIEPQPSNPRYLLTEPWVGYRFSIPEES